ncbi:MAG: PQQ-dependent sugar dehydrogenase [Gemmatimonadetes bacterium]|nr:PQQ-dependent sugar dehydrogenase [Gemmatimonadota bacterium]
MTRRALTLVVLFGGASAVAWSAQNVQPAPVPGQEPFSRRVVASGLAHPWEIAWGPDGHFWVTERSGKRVTRVNPADGTATPLVTIAEVHQSIAQDGLLGLALHPRLLRGTGEDFVYVAYTYDTDPGPDVNRRLKIRRFTYEAGAPALGRSLDVITDLPAHNDHIAGRLAVGPDDKLYLTIGDQGSNFLQNYCNPNRAQELPTAAAVQAQDWAAYEGKVLRLNLDGSVPADNPTIGGVRSHIYSYGHRNPQGLAFGRDGQAYASEHGPSTDDEVNLLEAGKNYGWPLVAGYRDDQVYAYANWAASEPEPCTSLKFSEREPPPSVPRQNESAWSHPEFRPPMATFFTVPNGYDFRAQGGATIAPSSLEIYTAAGIPGWADSLLVPGLVKGRVYRLKLGADGRSVAGPPVEIFRTTNRYRDLALNPDGRTIYLATDNEGRTTDASGAGTPTVEHPGAILAFTYTGTGARTP